MSDDYIKREDVLNYIQQKAPISPNAQGAVTVDIEALPAAPVREDVPGRWLSTYEYCKMKGLVPSGFQPYWYCSECEDGLLVRSNFCPNCGADMRGEEGEK